MTGMRQQIHVKSKSQRSGPSQSLVSQPINHESHSMCFGYLQRRAAAVKPTVPSLRTHCNRSLPTHQQAYCLLQMALRFHQCSANEGSRTDPASRTNTCLGIRLITGLHGLRFRGNGSEDMFPLLPLFRKECNNRRRFILELTSS